MNYQVNPSSLRSFISRRTQIAFVAGLVLGILLGWAFSGVVSAIMRFGLLALLLIPLVLALIFWWKVRRATRESESTIVTWSTTGLPPMEEDFFGQQRSQPIDPDEIVIDIDDSRGERSR